MPKVRVDKWLWAARFFKTRAKSRQAIDGGKVHVNGQRIKPSKELMLKDQLKIRQGWDEKIIVVKALSDQRKGAPEAQLLYEETAESIAKREATAEQRRAAGQHIASKGRPDKRDRRRIHEFLNKN
ncbi:MAG: RNA-binding protein [Gammaproteobacteria bacterium]|jgi:ribosome-associated heat shock protein Hsp15|nr:RNA-binding protein [Gammaproteobacteria bacterium]|tara:strand:+ start:3690 stop:4067 length:378 start_codon:yes stop_codon:yes gene_type:complete